MAEPPKDVHLSRLFLHMRQYEARKGGDTVRRRRENTSAGRHAKKHPKG